MKILFLTFCICISAVAFASPSDGTKSLQIQVVSELENSAAVQGAVAEIKNWSGAGSCEKIQIKLLTPGRFEATVVCNNPGDPEEAARTGINLSATGFVTVSGSVLKGIKKSSPPSVQIEKISFQYAG